MRPVIGRAAYRCFSGHQPHRGDSQRAPGGIEQRVVIETGLRAGLASPDIPSENHQRLNAVRERCVIAVAGLENQTECSFIPGDRPVDIGDREMHSTKAQFGRKSPAPRGGHGGNDHVPQCGGPPCLTAWTHCADLWISRELLWTKHANLWTHVAKCGH